MSVPLNKSAGRILTIDDDIDGVDALKYLLESEGYVVDSAGNGREGLQHLHDGPKPCVVILDLAMPVMTGWQFLAARDGDAALAKIPVIVVTASRPASYGRCEPVMVKPIDLDALLDQINSCCQTKPPTHEH